MNAKKIMGAVLVALLAAALFVGAGAAEGTDYGTVYLYQKGLNALDGTWTNGDYTVTISGGVVLGEKVVAGTYTKGKDSIYVSLPTATYSAKADIGAGKYYAVMNGGKLYSGNTLAIEAVATNSTVGVTNLYVTYPNGVAEKVGTSALNVDNLVLGTYKVQAIFSSEKFVDYVPENLLTDTVNSFTFTVVKAGDATITAAVDTVIVGDGVKLIITGQPGEEYTLVLNGFSLANNPVVAFSGNTFTMPNNGAVDIYVVAGSETGDKTVAIKHADEEVADVTVEIIEGSISAKADAESYYIGNTIKLSGDKTVSGTLKFYIKGTNTPLIHLETVVAEVEADKSWTAEIKGTTIRGLNLDAASYTIYVSADAETIDDIKDFDVYTTVGVALKQPFISITEAPEVVIQGGEAKIKGTAEATDVVGYYIFGTNFFKADNTSATVKNGEFTVTLGKGLTEKMAAGQYFAVIQHKMYDNKFNIYAEDTKIILEPTTGVPSLLFNVTDRQKANAAEALCQALDTENIDDMYVKLSFVVAAPTSVINPIPAEVTQGTKLTVSGTATGLAGEVVTVEMLSTAFAAVPKNTVGSASFIALTTKVADDGTWEVTFDTAGLNVDEYTVTAAVGQFDATTTKVNVVEKAPVTPEQPDTPVTPEQPEQPEQPTEPETPGFGALAALAGLGAVAVLLLRRE